MELEHLFTIPVPPEQAWKVLLDVEQIAPCMPGATVDSVDGDVIKGRIKVKVGPVALTYAGTAQFVERDEQSRTVTLEASGKETRGSGTASATIRSTLQDEGAQTKVVVHTTMSVTGRPAQFGRGVMAEVGGRIIERFATNLAALLAGGGTAGESTADGGTAGESTVGESAAAGTAAGTAASNGSGPGASASGPGAPAAAAEGAVDGAGGPADSAERPADGPATIEDLQLPARAYNSLRRVGIHTVDDLSARTEADLLAIENLGPQSVREIRERLAGIGRHLADQGADGSGASTPSAGPATAPRAPRPPDEDAIDLLSVAGFPVLKRALPVLGALVVLILVILGIRSQRRRSG